jgi:hypothetical protein
MLDDRGFLCVRDLCFRRFLSKRDHHAGGSLSIEVSDSRFLVIRNFTQEGGQPWSRNGDD